MKITLFTSNKKRHNYFINILTEVCDELFVIQESGTIFPGIVPDHYPASETLKKYFDRVNGAQNKFFGNSYIESSKKLNLLPILKGDLNKLSIKTLDPFLQSDLYIVFGSSFIKGDLINFLINKKAINIHMGVSPFYRGTDCNFWALYDDNPHLVGATIHLLTNGLDNGPILYHAMPKIFSDPFEYSMSAVKSAFLSIKEKILNNTILKFQTINQDKSKEIRYSTKKQFNDLIVEKYSKKKLKIRSTKFDKTLLVKPFFAEHL